jgi:uncharacterized protein YhbP (UPF0306 family)
MDVKQLISQHLADMKIMQLATSLNDEPWVCTLHFYADEQLNLYWVSRTNRHHSQQIAQNPNVSATILVHENTPDEDYVIAVTIAGTAELLTDGVDETIRSEYQTKHQKPDTMLPDPTNPNDLQKFYRFKPARIVLFDTKNFLESPRQVLGIEL